MSAYPTNTDRLSRADLIAILHQLEMRHYVNQQWYLAREIYRERITGEIDRAEQRREKHQGRLTRLHKEEVLTLKKLDEMDVLEKKIEKLDAEIERREELLILGLDH